MVKHSLQRKVIDFLRKVPLQSQSVPYGMVPCTVISAVHKNNLGFFFVGRILQFYVGRFSYSVHDQGI